MPNFEEMPDTELPYTEGRLSTLKKWCEENISKDVIFQDEPCANYHKYLMLTESYMRFLKSVAPDAPISAEQIHEAVRGGYHYFLGNELNKPEDHINTTFEAGMTPLHIAASKGFLETVRVLLAKGGNPHILNQEGQLPLHSALLLPMLRSSILIQHKIAIFELLFDLTPHATEAKDKQKNSIAHLIARYGLLNPEISVELAKPNSQGEYPIHLAIQNNNSILVQSWLNRETAKQKNQRNGLTTLHYLARYGTPELIMQYHPYMEHIDIPDHEGRTPLMVAAAHNTWEVFQYLRECGARIDCKDKNQRSVIDYARDGRDITIFHNLKDETDQLRPR